MDVNNILVKEEIEVYAAPSSLTFYDGLNVVWKPPKADLNQDGIVNFLDLAILSEHWLEGK